MFMRVSLLLLVGLTGSSLVACAAPSAGDQQEGNLPPSSTATAIVVVERTAGPNDAVRGDVVTARFVRTSQGVVDDPALRMAGVAEDILLTGTCTAPTDQNPIVQKQTVELLEVGQVVLESQGPSGFPKSTQLMPRSMPDPAGVVSGFFYTSRSADVFAPGSRVSLRTTGGALDGFNVTVTAPRDIADVRVSTIPNGLDVSWDASEADPRDVIYVDVLSPAPRVALRCTGSDVGHLTVATNLDEGQVAVHRLHKETFRAKGIEPGEVRFDVAKIVAFRK